jgi:hypothetical protein
MRDATIITSFARRGLALFAIVGIVIAAGAAASSAAAAEELPVGLPDVTVLRSTLTDNALAEARRLAGTATTKAGVKKQRAKMQVKSRDVKRRLSGFYGGYYLPCTKIPTPPYGDLLSCGIAGRYTDGQWVWAYLITLYSTCNSAAYQQGYPSGCFPPFYKTVDWWYQDDAGDWWRTGSPV